ncbi:MAG: hypothetical protein KA715_05655 [Xanthomonadaceae bacterium]|nr:hypothetical protein [Xanthomonadaceae bacterium]
MKNFKTVKTNTQILALGACTLLASACSMNAQTASITVKLPGKPSNALASHVSGSMNVGGVELPPAMSLGDVNCLFVNVIAMDIPPASWDGDQQQGSNRPDYKVKVEKALEGEPCGYAGITSKVVPFSSASTLNLNVPMGQQRVFQLLGVKAPSGTCTSEMDAQTFFAVVNNKITPSELGRVITNVNGSMSVNLSGRFDETRNMNHCSVDGGGSGPEWYFDAAHKVATGKPIHSVSYGPNTYFAFQRASGGGVEVLRIGPDGTWPMSGNIDSNFSTNGATSYDITVDPSGSVFVSYTIGMNVYVKKMVSDSTWTILGTPPSTPYPITSCRISSDSLGKIYSACNQGASYPIHGFYYNGSTWLSVSIPGITPSAPGKIAMSVGPDDNAIVAIPVGSAVKVFKINSAVTLVGAGPSQTGYSEVAPTSQINLVIKPDGSPIVSFVDGASIKVGDCSGPSNCTAAADTWTSRDITGLTNPGSNLVMKMNMNWEPVVFFYSDLASVSRGQIMRLNISGGFVWQPMQDPMWLTPSTDPDAGASLVINTNALGLDVDDNGVIKGLVSNPSSGTAYIKF